MGMYKFCNILKMFIKCNLYCVEFVCNFFLYILNLMKCNLIKGEKNKEEKIN